MSWGAPARAGSKYSLVKALSALHMCQHPRHRPCALAITPFALSPLCCVGTVRISL